VTAAIIEIDGKMQDINDFQYIITDWDGSAFETTDIEEAKLAIREDREVLKRTRRLFQSGPALVRVFVSVEIKKIKNL